MATLSDIKISSFEAMGVIVEGLKEVAKADPDKLIRGLKWLETTNLTEEGIIYIYNSMSTFDPSTQESFFQAEIIFDFVEGKLPLTLLKGNRM